MSRFKNSGAEKFLARIVEASLDREDDKLTARCKFNFSYFTVQPASQAYGDWDYGGLIKLLEKLNELSRESLDYWKNNRIKGTHGVLTIYGPYPQRSDMVRPKHVPHQALWGRFKLERRVRLVGFVVPEEYRDRVHAVTGKRFDCDTFYIVFLDADHVFYKGKEEA